MSGPRCPVGHYRLLPPWSKSGPGSSQRVGPDTPAHLSHCAGRARAVQLLVTCGGTRTMAGAKPVYHHCWGEESCTWDTPVVMPLLPLQS